MADTPLDPRHPGLPGGTAKPVELGIGPGTAIARQHLNILNRQIQLVTAGVDNLQTVMGHRRNR